MSSDEYEMLPTDVYGSSPKRSKTDVYKHSGAGNRIQQHDNISPALTCVARIIFTVLMQPTNFLFIDKYRWKSVKFELHNTDFLSLTIRQFGAVDSFHACSPLWEKRFIGRKPLSDGAEAQRIFTTISLALMFIMAILSQQQTSLIAAASVYCHSVGKHEASDDI